MLEKGCKWVVGNGKSINIWNDPWPNHPPSFRVISTRKEECNVELVSDLTHNTGGWNEDVVHANFLHFKAEEIMNISIASTMMDDMYVWSYSKLVSIQLNLAINSLIL